ncbi:MAG: hypothetical protein AB7F20_06990 [Geoalkalibacter sp.]|uniref:hypothetical protein n=1 Tax=Geoalkalibacter sp. TaxID=3041440 RepID=UPI002A950519|nr:hypothetical protein [Thermodesulfobacteriota bacterium]
MVQVPRLISTDRLRAHQVTPRSDARHAQLLGGCRQCGRAARLINLAEPVVSKWGERIGPLYLQKVRETLGN